MMHSPITPHAEADLNARLKCPDPIQPTRPPACIPHHRQRTGWLDCRAIRTLRDPIRHVTLKQVPIPATWRTRASQLGAPRRAAASTGRPCTNALPNRRKRQDVFPARDPLILGHCDIAVNIMMAHPLCPTRSCIPISVPWSGRLQLRWPSSSTVITRFSGTKRTRLPGLLLCARLAQYGVAQTNRVRRACAG